MIMEVLEIGTQAEGKGAIRVQVLTDTLERGNDDPDEDGARGS